MTREEDRRGDGRDVRQWEERRGDWTSGEYEWRVETRCQDQSQIRQSIQQKMSP